MPQTVLIASAEHLSALKQKTDYADAQGFSDTEALRALDAIMRQKPAVVALEKSFAATSRGAALINRIKADPSLNACEIRVIGPDGAPVPVRRKRDAASAAAPAKEPPPPAAPVAPLDHYGTRRAPRFMVVEGVEVLCDGNPATLVNLSIVGAQVLSPTILKPNQRIRMSLPDLDGQLRFGAGVAWAAFEMPKAGPRYRAGIEFFDAEADAISRVIEAKKRE